VAYALFHPPFDDRDDDSVMGVVTGAVMGAAGVEMGSTGGAGGGGAAEVSRYDCSVKLE